MKRRILFLLALATACSLQPAAYSADADYKHLGVASCATSVCHGKLSPAPGKHVALNEYHA